MASKTLQDMTQLRTLGTLWQKDGLSRVYFDTAAFYGLTITRYKTGNISSARLRGAKISNTKAEELCWKLEGQGKFWFDEVTATFQHKNLTPTDFAYLVAQIEHQLA